MKEPRRSTILSRQQSEAFASFVEDVVRELQRVSDEPETPVYPDMNEHEEEQR